MSEQKENFLAPPVLAAIKNEEIAARVKMERTASQEIRDERADLKEAAEQSSNVILDLGLDGTVRWVSPSWRDVIGTPVDVIQGKPIATILEDQESNPFMTAVDTMRGDDSRSQIIRFRTRLGPESIFYDDSPTDEALPEDVNSEEVAKDEEAVKIATLEGQGIMVYDRGTGGESHVSLRSVILKFLLANNILQSMWMLRPASEPREITIDLPDLLIESLGFGAEVLANYLTALADHGSNDPASYPQPPPLLCRICECQIPPWWFEKHTDLCLQEHKAEAEVLSAHETLTDHRTSIVKVLDALEASRARSATTEPLPLVPPAEYKGLIIGPNSASSSNSASGRATPATPPRSRSRDVSTSGFGHSRARSFAVRRPLSRIVELILDLCDTAIEIKTPMLSESSNKQLGEFRTSTPGSESRMSQVLNWQTPGSNTLENEEGLSVLASDTESIARAKVEAVLRHRRILEYSERIRVEFHGHVQDCIEAAMRKAASIREGRLSDSSDTESEAETPAPQNQSFFSESQEQNSPGLSAMAMALRNVSETAVGTDSDRRRSVAISTGSNSPLECPTPRSHSVAPPGLTRSQSTNKRTSLYGGSDTGDISDGSLPSALLSSGRRTGSPGQEPPLARSQSSRDRKRRSLKLPAVSASPRRQSPSRGPASPLRLSRHRIPSGPESGASPLTSPMLTTKEPLSPSDHRRQPSATSVSDPNKASLSPKLSASNPPQQRAVPPSIKDFEIIKPISKGAFGSVYLSKKKSTGDYYAIKVLKKSDMVAKNQVTNVKAERAIMMWQGESEFVAKLYWTFASKDYLYLVMEYLNGGDCASLIKVLGGLPEDWSKKYLAEVVLGVEHLHSRGIVHRDLKPDNLLIDQKGHLKLTDFGLSRMGLIGRQKRLLKSPSSSVPDLLKSGPFGRPLSMTSSRSTSFDFQGANHSPAMTPDMTPDLAASIGHPSYFSLSRDNTLSKEHSRRASGYRSDSGSSDTFSLMFKGLNLDDPVARGPPIEEETGSEGTDTADPYSLQPLSSSATIGNAGTPPQSGMLPPPMALFDPEDQNRRFVGTPDYLAPETVNGFGQDELSDWWSIGCILFEFLFGYPPFHAETPEKVFENILARRIEWPSEEECLVSDEARNLMSRLMTTDPKERLGSNIGEKHKSGGEEIRKHPWFDSINWDTLLEDEAQFVPNPENPEDTEYFDARGATLQAFSEEFEEQANSPIPTPGADYPDRPHDALSGLRKQVNSMKRGLIPLHIPAHVRDNRSRRLSEPVASDDFGTFTFKNLPVLEKANKDVIQKLRAEALKEQSERSSTQLNSGNNSPAPSVEASPLLPSPLKRTLSPHKTGNRSASPSNLVQPGASPNRVSQPTSPMLVQFSAGLHHERRKTSSTSSNSQQSGSLQPSAIFEPPRLVAAPSSATSNPSPIKPTRPPSSVPITSPDKGLTPQRIPSLTSPRARSQTVGSQDGDNLLHKPGIHHHKRRSQVFDLSPSSSDNEDPRAKALLRVQRRRQSSRRMSQFSLADGPCFRPLDVLICEDHPVSRLVMEKLFEKLRCRTISVMNGPDAIRFATSEVQFDIMMMEVKLPQLSGADVARMIRGTKNANQQTPIVAVTGYLKELPQNHHFNSLIEKPPTLEKLTEVLCNLCQWKAPPPDWRPGPSQRTPSGLRQESHPADNSPSSQVSSTFARAPDSLFHGSSREDSIGSSSLYGDIDPADTSVIIHGQNDGWGQGLGITDDSLESADFTHPGLPHLLHFNSAPPQLGLIMPSPRKPRSSEAIRAKREEQEKNRHECVESGDDEDEELGDTHVQPKSPRHRSKSSKLGTQMMRIDSYENIASELGQFKTEIKRPVPSDSSAKGGEPQSAIEPPEIFPKETSAQVADIDMDATPKPSTSEKAVLGSNEPTPRK